MTELGTPEGHMEYTSKQPNGYLYLIHVSVPYVSEEYTNRLNKDGVRLGD
jgi:hypothetical protein